MTLADDLNAPPLARRVAEIIKEHAARLELGPDWADAAAVRVLVEVGRSNADSSPSASLPDIDWAPLIARREAMEADPRFIAKCAAGPVGQ